MLSPIFNLFVRLAATGWLPLLTGRNGITSKHVTLHLNNNETETYYSIDYFPVTREYELFFRFLHCLWFKSLLYWCEQCPATHSSSGVNCMISFSPCYFRPGIRRYSQCVLHLVVPREECGPINAIEGGPFLNY